MIKPNMPNIPGIGAMTDTLEFVKNLWGGMGLPGMNMAGMNVPGMVMPTLSVEEINKKITDLKAVESWLTLNMNMLRGTIQALEVQAATISTLQSMGESFSATMGAGMMDKASAGGFSASANGTNGTNGSSGAAGGNGNGGGHPKAGGAPEPTSKDESDAAALTAPLVNAAAWWNMLQDQFKQAVNNAMATEAPATAVPEEKKQRPKPKAASATSSGTTRKRKTAK